MRASRKMAEELASQPKKGRRLGRWLEKRWGKFITFIKDLFGLLPYLRYREREDRRRRLLGQSLTLIALILGAYYLWWHLHYINWHYWYISLPFFLAECIGWLLFFFFAFVVWYPRYHNPEGLPTDHVFSVDVFITTCGEPLEVLRPTVAAATRIDYPAKTIYVLDDRNNPEVAALAAELGVNYLARPEHKDAKAGNLNYGFAHSNGELILTLDADQVPEPDILKRLVGYFRIPSIAFVQTKQNFIVPVGDPFCNTDKIFYNVMQTGKDTDNAAFSCGSGVIYRRRALEEIGGFSTWNLVEDVHTSMLLHQRGWRSIYYNYPLTLGTAPADIRGVYRQRRQWAVDSLRLMFWDCPLFKKGLSLRQRLQYFNLGFVYLVSAWFMPIFFLVPVLAIFFDIFVLTASIPDYIIHRLPYFLAMSVAYGILNYPTPYLHAYQMWTGLFPVFMQATIQALRHRRTKPVYKVTTKEPKVQPFWSALLALSPQLTIIILNIAAIIYGAFFSPAPLDFRLLNCAWATWAVWTMSGIVLAGLFKVRWHEEAPEPAWFDTKTIIKNVLGLCLFIFVFLLAAVLILQLSGYELQDVLRRSRP